MSKLVDGVIRIPTTLGISFFKNWLEFLRPFHKLSEKEIHVFASILKERFELSQSISDEELLDKVVLSEEYRKKVQEDSETSKSHYLIILSKLRSKNLIIDNRINKKFIPSIKKDSNNFKLMLYFEINGTEGGN